MARLEPFIIATHQKPDADALVSTWLAKRYLAVGQTPQIVFVPRSFVVNNDCPYDCVLDVGRQHVPSRLIFDHKPPGIADRNSTCATRLVWDYLKAAGHAVHHLENLVVAVHEGDHRPPRANASTFRKSKQDGFHGFLTRLPRAELCDDEIYHLAEAWLEGYLRRCRQPKGNPESPAFSSGNDVTLTQRYVRGEELGDTLGVIKAMPLTKAMAAKLAKLATKANAAKFPSNP